MYKNKLYISFLEIQGLWMSKVIELFVLTVSPMLFQITGSANQGRLAATHTHTQVK